MRNALALTIVVLAGSLSATWALTVPIFQATDEAAHFDYAMTIFSAGRLIATPGRTTAWIASPYTRYLLGATDYFRLAFHSSMRVPAGYGTLAYYRRIDAGAPSLTAAANDGGPISFIAPAYPFGFYALEALWMKLAAALTHSLVATFFAARLLCVLLMMIGLYFSYRTALNVGISPWLCVALVAIAGFFPLTTLVSSYVQPDNLAFALVAASLFLSTQLRRSRRPALTTLGLGLTLGFLAITKYHFFASAALPTAALALASIWRERLTPPAIAGRIAALALPSLALLALQHSLAPTNYAQTQEHMVSTGLLGSLVDVLQRGIAQTLAFVAAGCAKAFVDFFVTGPNAATYWGELGLWDTPLVVINAGVELALRALISLGSVAAVALVLYRLVRNLVRLRTVASRRGLPRALSIATSDPMLNAYAIFTAIMFALYVATDNGFGAAGRQWYPFVFAAFACAVWYAPRTLPSTRRRWPAIVAVALIAYVALAAGYATAAMIHRYYGPSETRYVATVPSPASIAPGRALGYLWPIQGMDFHPLAARRFRSTFAPGARLWAGGAAIFEASHEAANDVAVVVDGRFPAKTIAGQYDFQIAEATRDLTYAYSGFFGAFDTAGLAEGAHLVTAYAKIPQRTTYREIFPRRFFFLTTGKTFSASFLRMLRNVPTAGGALDEPVRCPGGILLIGGRYDGALGRDSAVWFLVDGKPYPARAGEDGRSFLGELAPGDLSPGAHDVTAYVVDAGASRYLRIPGDRTIVSGATAPLRLTWSAPPAPAACNEPAVP